MEITTLAEVNKMELMQQSATSGYSPLESYLTTYVFSEGNVRNRLKHVNQRFFSPSIALYICL